MLLIVWTAGFAVLLVEGQQATAWAGVTLLIAAPTLAMWKMMGNAAVWFIVCIMAFLALFPWLYRYYGKRPFLWLLAASVLFAAFRSGTVMDYGRLYYQVSFHLWQFLLGMWCASWNMEQWKSPWRWFWIGAGAAWLLASSAARDAVYLRLTAEVASAYINVRTWEEKCLIIRRVHASYEQTCAMYEKRFVQGQYPELALRRVQAERSKTLAQLRLSENELSRAESVLSVLVGDSPRQVMKGGRPGGGNAALLASPPVIPARLPGDMIERRPDIWELESRLKAAFYGREAARKDRFPSLVLTGQLGQVSTQLNELLNQSSRNYELGAGILQTLFDGGRKRAAVRAADAECAAVQAAYEQAVLNAFREIRDALVERRKSAEVYEATLDEVNCLRRSWDIASRQYEAGYVGLMDALDTHRSLLSGELDMADAAQMRLNAVVKFCKALGGGWQRRPGSS